MLSGFLIHYNVGYAFKYTSFIILKYITSVATLLRVFIMEMC